MSGFAVVKKEVIEKNLFEKKSFQLICASDIFKMVRGIGSQDL